MFLRNKRVGNASYIQLVESSRRGGEPRINIIANLGRADKLRESGVLDKLAKNLASYSDQVIAIDGSSGVVGTRIPCAMLQEFITEKAVLNYDIFGLNQHITSSNFRGREAIGALSAVLFRNRSSINVSLMETLSTAARYSSEHFGADALEGPDSIHIYIEATAHEHLSPLRGSVTVTVAKQDGTLLSCMNWPGFVPIADVIRKQIKSPQFAQLDQAPTVFLGRRVVNGHILRALVAKNIQFVAVLREAVAPGNPSLRFQEGRFEFPSLSEVGPLRFLRAVDDRAAAMETQVRELQLSRMAALHRDDAGVSRGAANVGARILESAEWAGSTIIATNLKGSANEVASVYFGSRPIADFQQYSNSFFSDIATHIDFPRAAADLANGFITAQAVAATTANALARGVSGRMGRTVTWPMIADVVTACSPVMIGQGRARAIAFALDEPVLGALLGELDIDMSALLEGLKGFLADAKFA
jgi:hypothetical protein